MANPTPKQPEKISADCPHCGFSQLESSYAKTTFCRKCGEHFSIEKMLAKEAGSLKPPSIFDRLSKIVSGEKQREIHCFSCGHKQVVSTAAQSSLCPSCGSYVDLRDFKIAGPFGRSVQTQGEVVVTSKGEVTSARIACGAARIEGKVRGNLICTGIVHLKAEGKMLGSIETETLIIEKKCNADFARPIKAKSVEVNGKISAIVHCDGCVTIHKGGHLDGTIHAKSVNFEKGGVFTGELHIGEHTPQLEQAELIDAPPADEGGEVVKKKLKTPLKVAASRPAARPKA